MISTPQEAAEKSALLADLKALAANRAWQQIIAPKIEQAHTDSLAGISDVKLSKDERAEHLHAYHQAVALKELAAKETEALREELLDWQKREMAAGHALGFDAADLL